MWDCIALDLSSGAGNSQTEQELCVAVFPSLTAHVCLLLLLLSPSGIVEGRRPRRRRRDFPFFRWLYTSEPPLRWQTARFSRGYLSPSLPPSSLCPRLRRMRTKKKTRMKKKRRRRKSRCRYRCRYCCCCYRCYCCCCSLSFSRPVSSFLPVSPSSAGSSSSPASRSLPVFRSCFSPRVWIRLA